MSLTLLEAVSRPVQHVSMLRRRAYERSEIRLRGNVRV